MKNIVKMSGSRRICAITLAVVIGLAFAACPNPSNSDPVTPVSGPPALSGTVSITGIAQVGQTLSANTGALGGSGVITFQWMRDGNVVGSGSTYIVQAADAGYTITVTVTRSDNSGSKTSEPTAAVTPANQTPVAEDFNIGNLTQTVGSVTAVTITPKTGKSIGTITIYYEGSGGTYYPRSITRPTTAGTYTVTFNVAAVTGWNAVNGLVAGTLTINPANGTFGNPAAINTTYTSTLTLANLSLPTGYTWNYPTTSLNAGNGQSFPATYTDPSGNYTVASGNITVNVAKANGTFGTPATINITYTPSLILANLSLPIGYAWNSPTTSVSIGNGQSFPATYTEPSSNYTVASGNIIVNVAEASGEFGNPAAINTTYTPTLTLANLSLPIGYTWNVPTTSLNAGNGQQFQASYTDPSGNYEPASGNITVNVAKANGVFGDPTEINTTYTPTLILASLTLQTGYTWNIPTTNLNAGNGQTFSATYIDPSGNYEPAGGNITVNIAKATGATVEAPTLVSKTNNSITINAVTAPGNGQTVEYAKNTDNNAPTTGWQNDTTFNGLNAGTTYYFFARSASNGNYETGVASSGIVITTMQQAGVNFSIEQIIDKAPVFSNITLSRTNNGYPTTYPVSVNASDYDTGSIIWEVAGVGIYSGQTVTGSGPSFTLNAADIKYNSLGGHVLILTVTKEGLQYKKAIPFTIVQ